ncbi:MAG: branched-chain amino acid ABC transporter ATP-binding protein/permease [Desulfarculus sp.]|nr:branched-chain amino acid ABC transporter ATP-binding protein/permease [Pseudomonadota bacterium]MBV1716063.1 branched-chain amino acid ABC transporter ATP-binding protein/permease [Desulfarculus sp.]MBV1738500.1 branched-chain amino acid ABC transporter ATP-binding protein/permease [Desulfarculus sp.]MBV1750580.1 branched-chain amino acid ABC transporter ATP-binding protein/permease [Desulfarculus sp.]
MLGSYFKNIGAPGVYFPSLILLALLAVAALVPNEFYLNLFFMIFMFAGLSGAWNIIGGYAGQISLGHAAFYGVGAYTSAVLFAKLGLPPVLGIFASMGVAVVLAFIIGYPCLRLKGPFFTLATLAVAEVLQLLAVYFRGLTEGSEGLSIPYEPAWYNLIFASKNSYAVLAFGYMVLVLVITLVLERSKLGYQLTALRDEDQAAESLGVNTSRAKIAAFVLSGALTALGAVIVSQYVLFLEPHSDFSVNVSVELALMSMVGGLGTAVGPLIGAAILIPLGEFLRAWVGGGIQGLHYVIYGCILILVVMFMPHGIKALVENKYQALMALLPRFGAAARPQPEEEVHLHFESHEAEAVKEGRPLIAAHEISKDFGGLRVLSGISFAVHPGEILGIIGPNGAGKTTLFNVISGVYRPTKGRVEFDGQDITQIRRIHQVCHLGMGRTYQIVKPFGNMSVLDNVMVGAFCNQAGSATAREIALEVLALVGLLDKKDQEAKSLTLANMKRLEMARALATKPKLLLLDEVMAGLNPNEIDEAIKLIRDIRDYGSTVIVVEHVMRAIMSLSERIMVIAQGEKVTEGLPREVIADQRVIKAYLGDGFELA